MSLDLCLKQLHVEHINVFHRIQYIRLLLFYSVSYQSEYLLRYSFGYANFCPVFTARRYAKRGIYRRRVSVCVCVCHTSVLYQNS